MKKITLLFIAMIMANGFVNAATGWFNDFLTIKVNGVETANNYYLGDNPGSGTALQGTAFGTVSSLELSNIDLKYWSDTQDRTGGALYYKIMSADGSTQIVAPYEIVWAHSFISGNNYQGSRPVEAVGNLSFLTGLTYGVTYQLQVYAKHWGTNQPDNWLSNSGANYVATFTLAPPTSMSGTYKVGTASGASFSSLSHAINTINTVTVAGDITLEINSDITEAANFGLAKDLGIYKLTIRPDADANRTITFTQATANTGPWGHFVIGCSSANLGVALTESTLFTTNNVIIDGYAFGGNTRRLKFTTNELSLANSILTDVVGGCQNITIKNCIYENNSIGSTSRCIYLFVVKNGAKDLAPSNILIDNNQLICFPSTSVNGIGIQCNGTGTPTARIANLDITNNYIKARSTGIEVYYSNGVEIYGNEIRIQKGTTIGSGIGVWLRGHTGDMYVSNNKFTELSSIQTGTGTYATQGILTGASITNPFNIFIYNNTFSGMDRSVSGPAALNQVYIAEIGYGTTKIIHNTFYLPALTLSTQAGTYNAISFTTANYKADVQNNIFISNEDAKSVFISKVITTGTVNNNLYYLRAGNTNARIVDTYPTLAAYQLANATIDVNSKSKDVEFVSTTNLSLTGTSINDIELGAPRLATVLTDFSGTTSRAATTYMGAHEASDLTGAIPSKTFTVTVPNGTSKVYLTGNFTGRKWNVTAPHELTATANPNEFAGTFACANDVTYKYLCETADMDYQAAVSAGGVAESNRTYTAADVVAAWLNMKTVKLNVSFSSATAVPTQLFVKGSWDAFVTPIELTKSDNTFSTTLSGILANKIPTNTEYKFFTNDMNTDNWESNADNSSRTNRWSIYPVMNDEIARFTTQVITSLGNVVDNANILRTSSGIEVVLNNPSTIELYNANGMLIEKTITNGIYTRSLNNGVYIININGKATKFVK